jgi:hypothetical protein
LVPYHFFTDSPGSKRFVIDAADAPASFFAGGQSLVPEIGRRDALKIGVAGTVAIATLGGSEKKAQAVPPVVWWLAGELLIAAGGWLLTKVLDKLVGPHIDSALSSMKGVVGDLTKSGKLFTQVEKTLVTLDTTTPNQLHVATADRIKFDDKVIVQKQDVPGYKLPFGVKRRFTSTDPTMTLEATTKLEAARDFHQGAPLLPENYRMEFTKDLYDSLTEAFDKAKGLYNPSYDIAPGDVAWVQSMKDADHRSVWAFGLKADAAEKAKVPVLLT